jgi:hypothetical protein
MNSAQILFDLSEELNDLYRLGDKASQAKHISPLMQQLSQLSGLSIPSAGIHQQPHDNVSGLLLSFFDSVDVNRLGVLPLITILRTTYAHRAMASWQELRDRSHQSLIEKKLDVTRILRGLLD